MTTLFEIEKKYKKELEEIEEWAYLRSYYRHALATKNIVRVEKMNKFKIFKDVFFGFSSWFGSYQYLVFSDTNERKLINDKWFGKNIDFLMNAINQDQGLLIEEPNPIFFKRKKVYTKYSTSRRMLDGFALIIEKFLRKKIEYSILNHINQECNIDLDYQKQINLFNARYALHKFLFKMYKIKFVIVSCYYSRQYVIKVANDLNIETFEVQHGVITKDNDAYNSDLQLKKNYYPNYLLSFGENEKVELEKSGLINKEVLPVGSFYLDYLRRSFSEDAQLMKLKVKYQKTIGISLQKGAEEKMIKFIISVAKESKDILYIIIPRYFKSEEYVHYDFSDNIIFYPSLDCYQIIMHCDYHCTFYSACTVEVPSLGIPNILIDFNGKARLLYQKLENKTSLIVWNKEEFLNIIYQNMLLDTNLVQNNHLMIRPNYQENIEKLVNKGYFDVC